MNLWQELKEESRNLVENYRALAQKGMGTESEKDARVGLELDFYNSKGDKQFGKIVKKDRKGYTVKDEKGKTHTFVFLDRAKAKKLLAKKTDKLSNIIKKNTIKKGKFAGYMTDEVEEAVSPAQQAAIAIAKKEKGEKPKNESVMDAYRQMWEEGEKYAPQLDEEVANITVDPNNKIPTPAGQNKHSLEIVKQARRFGIKASQLGKHIRIKGNKKAVNDFLRIVIGKSSYGDPTEKDTSTPQIDKMLTKGLK
jgi:hypothetical protein